MIYLSDTEEQSGSNPSPATYINWLRNYDGLDGGITAHGIVCPVGSQCNNSEPLITPDAGYLHLAIRTTGGVDGDIQVANRTDDAGVQQLGNTVEAIVGAAIGATGHQLSRPAISSTIKVAMASTAGACDKTNVPRDRTNGWDLDSATNRIVFYGACIPSASGVQVAVSYRFWVDGSPDPNGDVCEGRCASEFTCDTGTATCVCPANCNGTCTSGLACNMASCACEPVIGKPRR
jgi:hypothetical protein